MQISGLKVLLLQDTTNYAGTEAHVLTLAKNLAKHTAVSPLVGVTADGELHRRCAAANIPYHVLPKMPGMFNLAGFIAVAKMLLNREVDVVHAHNGRTSLVAVCAKLLARRGNVVLTQHFIEPDYVNRTGIAGRLAGLVHRFVLANVDQHICISEAVKASFLKRQDHNAVNSDSVQVVQNGIDDVYETLDRVECRKHLISELNVTPETRLILCVARLEPEKDVQALLRSVSKVDSSIPFHCVIVGDGSERSRLEALVRDTKVQDKVSFLGFRDDVPSIMKAADIFVLPAPAEPFGLVVVEAMMAALPIVSIDNGGPSEIVIDKQTGFLVPVGDVKALSHAIKEIIEDTNQGLTMGTQGQRRAKAVYSSDVMSNNTGNVYALCGPKGQ
jgi:glycosyltransferase involved in cell wall biosynthesis